MLIIFLATELPFQELFQPHAYRIDPGHHCLHHRAIVGKEIELQVEHHAVADFPALGPHLAYVCKNPLTGLRPSLGEEGLGQLHDRLQVPEGRVPALLVAELVHYSG